MREVWIKKTVYRRYLISEDDVREVKDLLDGQEPNTEEIIGDVYDKTDGLIPEYDQEEMIFPIDCTWHNLEPDSKYPK